MCKHADHTEEIINHLIKDVYPVLDLRIDDALHCSNLESSKVPEKDLVHNLLFNLKDEFHSLATYEQKLVFPSVLKVFHAKKAKTTLPNLGDLLQLTRRKEDKINHYVLKINALIANHLWKTEKQEKLVNEFTKSFAAEKMLWNKMIQDRITSCECFKKNYFDMARLYESNELNSLSGSSKSKH